MNNEFERAFDIIIMHEGGETKYGITKRVARIRYNKEIELILEEIYN